uniref:LNS2/PITP domain-containing protein n=1 Tax=Chromera velia CCMP2878 TaxID=1169474 RepID=A0A0G4I194_9ALVE|eukprot:Cvel_44.t1-p1 / transcript=Cvel_44.t1 / gene=Cvel_44 / organism=Chromera_velia_CCMP2878 / gene_product=hypothetical protein / transcript_product=hypothetical protein / location=Cvel_scaffold5:260790-264015(-) / protein_length=686 / sequence_SO=supercontig / SO=protein_coding / is_pseudo=false
MPGGSLGNAFEIFRGGVLLPWISRAKNLPQSQQAVRLLVTDIDGTICNIEQRLSLRPGYNGVRSPEDWDVVLSSDYYHLDSPVLEALDFLQAATGRNGSVAQIVYLSGRRAGTETGTMGWLRHHGFPPGPIIHREKGIRTLGFKTSALRWVVRNRHRLLEWSCEGDQTGGSSYGYRQRSLTVGGDVSVLGYIGDRPLEDGVAALRAGVRPVVVIPNCWITPSVLSGGIAAAWEGNPDVGRRGEIDYGLLEELQRSPFWREPLEFWTGQAVRSHSQQQYEHQHSPCTQRQQASQFAYRHREQPPPLLPSSSHPSGSLLHSRQASEEIVWHAYSSVRAGDQQREAESRAVRPSSASSCLNGKHRADEREGGRQGHVDEEEVVSRGSGREGARQLKVPRKNTDLSDGGWEGDSEHRVRTKSSREKNPEKERVGGEVRKERKWSAGRAHEEPSHLARGDRQALHSSSNRRTETEQGRPVSSILSPGRGGLVSRRTRGFERGQGGGRSLLSQRAFSNRTADSGEARGVRSRGDRSSEDEVEFIGISKSSSSHSRPMQSHAPRPSSSSRRRPNTEGRERRRDGEEGASRHREGRRGEGAGECYIVESWQVRRAERSAVRTREEQGGVGEEPGQRVRGYHQTDEALTSSGGFQEGPTVSRETSTGSSIPGASCFPNQVFQQPRRGLEGGGKRL